MNENPPVVYAGLDIAKATLQLHLPHVHHVLNNDPAGHATLLQMIRAVGGVQMVCEATGGYEKGVVAALHAAGQPVSVLNPALVRHCAPWSNGAITSKSNWRARSRSPSIVCRPGARASKRNSWPIWKSKWRPWKRNAKRRWGARRKSRRRSGSSNSSTRSARSRR